MHICLIAIKVGVADEHPDSLYPSVLAPSPITSVTFGTLTTPGQTTVTTSTTGPPPPVGFNFANTFYNFTTATTFSGNLTVCIDYVPANYSNPGLIAFWGVRVLDITVRAKEGKLFPALCFEVRFTILADDAPG